MASPQILVLADDLTGLAEVASLAAARGWGGPVYPRPPQTLGPGIVPATGAPVLFVNLGCRAMPAIAARMTVLRTLAALTAGRLVTHVYLKVDSAARGPIGPMVEAVCEALAVRRAPVCLANPATGRTVNEGRLFVDGTPLAESAFRDDPLHPARESHLPTLLAAGTFAPKDASRIEVLDAGSDSDLESAAQSQGHARIAAGAAPFALALLPHWLAAAQGESRQVDTPQAGTNSPGEATLELRSALIVGGSRHPALDELAREFEDLGGRTIHAGEAGGEGLTLPLLIRTPPEAGDPGQVTWELAEAAAGLVRELRPGSVLVIGGETAQALIDTLAIGSFTAHANRGPVAHLQVAEGQPHEGMHVLLKPGSYGGAGLMRTLFTTAG